jgi:hypothetical protein
MYPVSSIFIVPIQNVIIQKRESEEGLVKVNKAMCKSGMRCAHYSEEMKGQFPEKAILAVLMVTNGHTRHQAITKPYAQTTVKL